MSMGYGEIESGQERGGGPVHVSDCPTGLTWTGWSRSNQYIFTETPLYFFYLQNGTVTYCQSIAMTREREIPHLNSFDLAKLEIEIEPARCSYGSASFDFNLNL